MPGIYSRSVNSQAKAMAVATMLIMSNESFQYQCESATVHVFTVLEHKETALDHVVDEVE